MRNSLINTLLCFLFFIGCVPSKDSKTLSLSWSSQPEKLSQGPGTFFLRFSRDEKPLENAVIEYEANMTHPGMVPVLGMAKEIQPGQYQIDLVTTMAGSWIMFLKIKTSNNEILEHNFSFEIDR